MSTPRPSPGPLDVLVVEDNIFNQRVLVAMLERMGHRPVAAGDGPTALQKLADNQYDVVLLDVYMPQMDGLEVCRQLRASEGPNRHITVVAFTASNSSEQREAATAAGMDLFLPKGVRLEALAELLAKVGGRNVTSGKIAPSDRSSAGGAALDLASPSAQPDTAAVKSRNNVEPGRRSAATELDPEHLEQLRALEEKVRPGLLHRMVSLYLTHMPARLEAVQHAVDPKSRANAAHILKGSSLSLGVTDVGKAADAIEIAARAGEPTDELVPALVEAYEAIRPTLEALLESSPDTGTPVR